MRPNTLRIPTSDARNALRSRLSRYSIEKERGPRGGGHGTAFVSSAGALSASSMGPLPRNCATQGFARGVGRTLQPRQTKIGALGSVRPTGSRRPMWHGCVSYKADAALFAKKQRAGSSLIIATPKATSAPCSAKPVIRSSAGTRRRPIRSSNFRDIWLRTSLDQPCHADVLLELANPVDTGGGR